MSEEKETLRPGSVHVFQPGRAIALGIGVWADKNEAGKIHIHVTGGEGFHTTVTNHSGSERYHRTLFRNLRRLLIEHGAWPYDKEGAETEEREPDRHESEGGVDR